MANTTSVLDATLSMNILTFSTDLDILFYNLMQLNQARYDIFYNPTPLNVQFQQVDDLGNTETVEIPNWAMLYSNLNSSISSISQTILNNVEYYIGNIEDNLLALIHANTTLIYNTSATLQSEIDIVDTDITNLSAMITTIPTPNSIPESESNGQINLGWIGLPPNGLLYYTSSEIYMGTSGGFATYEFDFTNWQNDYLQKVPNASSVEFLVIAIIQNQYMETSNGSESVGSYNIHLFASTKPTYLNGNFYQMQITLGQSDAAVNSTAYSSYMSPPELHSYSTLGAVGYLIHFIGGPKNILWNLLPYGSPAPGLQITCSLNTSLNTIFFSCYNSNPDLTYKLNSITINNGQPLYIGGAGSEIVGGIGNPLPITLPPYTMDGGNLGITTQLWSNTPPTAPYTLTFHYTDNNGIIYITNISNTQVLTMNINNIMHFPTNSGG